MTRWPEAWPGDYTAAHQALLAIRNTTRSLRFGKRGLSDGLAGYLLFLSRFDHSKQMIDLINRSASVVLSQEPTGRTFFSGFYGTLWCLDKLPLTPENCRLLISRVHLVDEMLRRWLADGVIADFDLAFGAVGVGIYALDRSSTQIDEELLDRVISTLLRQASKKSNTLVWHTARSLIRTQLGREMFPEGRVDLGLAHGNAGVLGFISKCILFGYRERELAPIAHNLCEYLLSHRMTEMGYPQFPSFVNGKHSSRLGWCYGDLSVAVSLAWAACALRDNAIHLCSADIIHRTLDRDIETGFVEDYGLCHGTSGIAYLYHKFANHFDTPRFQEASRRWYELTCDGLMGKISSAAITERRKSFSASLCSGGYLRGCAGMGLAIEAALVDQVSTWDSALLLDLPTWKPQL